MKSIVAHSYLIDPHENGWWSKTRNSFDGVHMVSHLYGISSFVWPNEKQLGFCVENEPNMF